LFKNVKTENNQSAILPPVLYCYKTLNLYYRRNTNKGSWEP